MIRLPMGQCQREPIACFRYRGKFLVQFNIGSLERPAIKAYSFTELLKLHPNNRHELIRFLYRQTQAYRRDVDRTEALAEVLNTRPPERQASRDLYVDKLYHDIQMAVAA